jgi:MFS family permease
VQGVGAGWISGFSYVAIGLLFPERHLARSFAAIAGIWGLATLVGPLVGGLFAQAHAWRGVFWLFAVQAVGFSLAALWLPPRDARDERSAGVPALQVLLIAAGVAAISVSGLGGGLLLAVGVGGLALLWVALRIDARSETRLFPRQASALSTPLGAGYAALLTMFAAGMGLTTYGPAVLQTLRGLSPLQAGYVIGAEAIGWTAAAFLVTGARSLWQARWIRIGAVLLVAALAGLALAVPDGPLTAVIAAGGLAGAAYGVSWSFISRAILAYAPEDERGLASSSLGAAQQTGTAVGAALSGAVANLSGAVGDTFTAEAARGVGVWVFLAALPLALLGVWFAWRLAAQAQSVPASSQAR